MNIGKKIYELRRKEGLSQEEVANKLDVSRQTVSKWETNQSAPDIDKIVPLCDLFNISTDVLLKGVNEQQTINTNDNRKKYTPLVVSVSVLLYFLSIIWIIIASESFHLQDDGLLVGVFLLIVGISTALLIYHFMSIPKKQKVSKFNDHTKKMVDSINTILSIFILIIYLCLSFFTNAWHITWILWIVYALLTNIVELVFQYKEVKNNER